MPAPERPGAGVMIQTVPQNGLTSAGPISEQPLPYRSPPHVQIRTRLNGIRVETMGLQAEAAEWSRKAAGSGDVAGMREWAIRLRSGAGVRADQRESAEWFRNASESGDARLYVMGIEGWVFWAGVNGSVSCGGDCRDEDGRESGSSMW